MKRQLILFLVVAWTLGSKGMITIKPASSVVRSQRARTHHQVEKEKTMADSSAISLELR